MSQTKAQLLDNIKDNVQLDAQKALRFADSDSSHYVAFRAPGTVSSSVTWTLPAADGSANYVLATDGSGTLSWIADPAGQWVTSGSNIYFTAGNVGIGDNSPSNPLSVTGASAFNGDVQFTGASYNVTWDKSADDLIFNDNAKAAFGTGSDLQIYHNGSHSYIHDTGTGGLLLRSNNFHVTNEAGNESIIHSTEDGAVEFYHDNSKKAETTSSGLTVTGNSTATSKFRGNDNVKLSLGDGEDIQVYHDGSHSYFVNSTGEFYIQAKTNENAIVCKPDGSTELYYNNSKKFHTHDTGGTITGYLHFADGNPASSGVGIGDSDDLCLYHNGSNSFISDRGTGPLYIRGNNAVRIEKYVDDSNGEAMIIANADGAVEIYHDNAKKFETNSTGCKTWGSHIFTNGGTITGGHLGFADDSKAKFGDGDDLQIYHNGTNSVIENNTGTLVVKPEGLMRIQDLSSNEVRADFNNNGSVDLYYDGSKKLETTSAGATLTGILSTTLGISVPDNENIKLGTSDDFTIHHNSGDGDTYFDNRNTGEKTIFRVSDSSALDLTAFDIASNGRLYAQCKSSSTASLTLKKDDTSADGIDYLQCRSDSNALKMKVEGDGDCLNVNNTYGSTSDLKLKENIVDANSQWADIKAVKVRNFNFKTDPDKKLLGVVAQEIETVSAGLVSESIDRDPETSEDLGTKTKSVKYSILYMKAFKALQEAMAKIETLETKVAALEG